MKALQRCINASRMVIAMTLSKAVFIGACLIICGPFLLLSKIIIKPKIVER